MIFVFSLSLIFLPGYYEIRLELVSDSEFKIIITQFPTNPVRVKIAHLFPDAVQNTSQLFRLRHTLVYSLENI